jgi:uncharacterized membrane protein HdeD (DUF308 family)
MSIEIFLGIIMILMGIVALVYALNARGKFPMESEMREITGSIIVVLVLLTCFSVWHVVREVLEWKKIYGEIAEYPEYILITASFLVLLITAQNIYKTAKKYGITD